ncbi:MAG: helix-turn-helix domain-containing protein [Halobacteriota archaeon]|jgi:hypothetical protein
MKDLDTKQKFLELRAQGKSLRTIEKEIGTSRRTLATWEMEYKEDLENLKENLKAVGLEALQERYRLTTKDKLERYGAELQRVTEELGRRDLTNVPTPKLYDLMIKLHACIEKACPASNLGDEKNEPLDTTDWETMNRLHTLLFHLVSASASASEHIDALITLIIWESNSPACAKFTVLDEEDRAVQIQQHGDALLEIFDDWTKTDEYLRILDDMD